MARIGRSFPIRPHLGKWRFSNAWSGASFVNSEGVFVSSINLTPKVYDAVNSDSALANGGQYNVYGNNYISSLSDVVTAIKLTANTADNVNSESVVKSGVSPTIGVQANTPGESDQVTAAKYTLNIADYNYSDSALSAADQLNLIAANQTNVDSALSAYTSTSGLLVSIADAESRIQEAVSLGLVGNSRTDGETNPSSGASLGLSSALPIDSESYLIITTSTVITWSARCYTDSESALNIGGQYGVAAELAAYIESVLSTTDEIALIGQSWSNSESSLVSALSLAMKGAANTYANEDIRTGDISITINPAITLDAAGSIAIAGRPYPFLRYSVNGESLLWIGTTTTQGIPTLLDGQLYFSWADSGIRKMSMTDDGSRILRFDDDGRRYFIEHQDAL